MTKKLSKKSFIKKTGHNSSNFQKSGIFWKSQSLAISKSSFFGNFMPILANKMIDVLDAALLLEAKVTENINFD